jgi:hypothetical protein
MFHSVIWSDEGDPGAVFQQYRNDDISEHAAPPRDAMYLIALCAESDQHLPSMKTGAWLFDDQDESVYSHYHHEIRKNMTAGEVLHSMEAELQQLRRQLGETSGTPTPSKPWWRRLFGGA